MKDYDELYVWVVRAGHPDILMRLLLDLGQKEIVLRNDRRRSEVEIKSCITLKERWELESHAVINVRLIVGNGPEEMAKQAMEIDHIRGNSTIDLRVTPAVDATKA